MCVFFYLIFAYLNVLMFLKLLVKVITVIK